MKEYRITEQELKDLLDAFINFDSKVLHATMDQVRSRELKGCPPGICQALNEGDGVYRP